MGMQPKIAITADAARLNAPGYLRSYKRAVERAGGEPVLVSGETDPARIEELLDGFDGLLLPGGADVDPAEYGGRDHPTISKAARDLDSLELEAARVAKRHDLPTLAICRGVQVMNVALGGTLWEDIGDQFEADNGLKLRHQQTPDHGRQETTHPVDLQQDSTVARTLGGRTLATNSMHHQALRRLAHDLVAVGKARDGVIEAVEARTNHPFFVGVQWHPEDLVESDEPSRNLFLAFVAQAEKRAQRRAARR
jgi:putative glutamine amidotransferase